VKIKQLLRGVKKLLEQHPPERVQRMRLARNIRVFSRSSRGDKITTLPLALVLHIDPGPGGKLPERLEPHRDYLRSRSRVLIFYDQPHQQLEGWLAVHVQEEYTLGPPLFFARPGDPDFGTAVTTGIAGLWEDRPH
jgi:hypothetical protein